VIAGICGGFAEYFNLDPTVVRVLWIFLTLFGGSGILLYVIAYFIIPLNPSASVEVPTRSGPDVAALIGIALVTIGGLVLLDNLDIFHFHRWVRHSWEVIIPSLLIALGVYILVRRKPEETPPSSSPPQPPPSETTGSGSAQSGPSEMRRLQRSVLDRKLFGVCGGLANYFGIDPTIVRILFVIFALMSFGFGLVLYVILFLIMPEERLAHS
jgi:phage shock protein C